VRKSPEFALGALIGNDPSSVNDAMRLAEVYRRSAEPEMIANILLQGSETDVTAKLSSIRCPAMVLHRLGDTVVPFAVGQALAARLPHATFISLPGSVHAYTTGDSGRVLEAIRGFTGTDGDVRVPRHAAAGHEPAFCTVLVTDLVGHTDMMQRLGDTRGRALLREYEQLTRATLKQHGGTEIKTLGDGFMASFSTVRKSIDCAIALQRAFAAYNASATEALNVRIGLNAGEPIAEHGDLFGSTVIMAARVAAKAGAGEILIPEPLRHLLTGKTYQYADRGETMLKGFEDAVRLYEVRWRA
jgi:class 3 adenylate cyclase